jgi:hypothetical protein
LADPKHKTPEELGDAVGKKIDELFGNLFADEQPDPEPDYSAEQSKGSQKTEPGFKTEPIAVKEQVITTPVAQKNASVSSQVLHASPTFRDIVDKIEALFLTLDWELNTALIHDLGENLRSLDHFLPNEGPAKTIVNMNLRVLPKLVGPEAAPHPAWLKLLQNSVAALDQIHKSGGKQPSQALISMITSSYKEISAALENVPRTDHSHILKSPIRLDSEIEPKRAPGDQKMAFDKMGSALKSVEEVSQRFSRILGVLRQGGSMSPDDITRRLGTLEYLLAERIEKLTSTFDQLKLVDPSNNASGNQESPGLILVMWFGISLAIPATWVSAVYPLPAVQAQQFAEKPTIRIANKQILRFPLKKPKGAHNDLPTWLIHLIGSDKELFLLVDKFIGYRKAPQGIDIFKETRIKIGQLSYALINEALLKTAKQ